MKLNEGDDIPLFRRIMTVFTLSIGILWLGVGCDSTDHQMQAIHDTGHGIVEMEITCNEDAQEEFFTGLAHLHHMMYEQARPHFEAAYQADAECAMAHWGVAMTSFYPLWQPSTSDMIERGQNAVDTAREIGAKTEREAGFIEAVAAYFEDPVPALGSPSEDHAARLGNWLDLQRDLHENYPEDVEAAAFYALAEISYATAHFSPGEEQDYSRVIGAGELLEQFFTDYPEHPGLFHYIIHAYDSPQLADRAVEAARGYDQVAPDTPHALHMPSHIFVRLGRWEETTEWNERSAEAALRQAEFDSHAYMHYVHALDYMMYGYLQMGQLDKAAETLERVRTVEQVPSNLASGYGVAAPQARYYLEQGLWEEAAVLELGYPDVIEWSDFPSSKALFAYARGLGAARTGDLEQAEAERDRIEGYVHQLRNAGNTYWAYMTEALGKAVGAWILYEQGEVDSALELMSEAADLEDSMDKHPISPGEVLPVRELYGELLMLEGRTDEAIEAFEASLERTPNRQNALNSLDQIAGL